MQSAYKAETSYVAGEFYWQVKRGQTSYNQDCASGSSLLSSEQVGSEITWSVGNKLAHSTVATAFHLKDRVGDFKRSAESPFASEGEGVGVLGWIVILFFVLILLFAITRQSRSCDPQYENCASSGARVGGGSYGSYSSGGGHK